MIGYLVANHLATLHELKSIYSLQDAMEMWEADYVPKYNEYMQSVREKDRAAMKNQFGGMRGGGF